MTDPVRVTKLYPKSTESKLDSAKPVQEAIEPAAGSWFIRYHVDGSWSVGTGTQVAYQAAGQAANDPDYAGPQHTG